jgi:cytochrome P450
MDPTSNAMSRIFHLMAIHPEVQDKVRQEILNALEMNEGRDFLWEELDGLAFLDAVCRETLRLSASTLYSAFSSLTSSVLDYSTVTRLFHNCCARMHFPTGASVQMTQDPNFRARKDVVLPFSTPITGIDGRKMDEIVVPNNTNVVISTLNCNCDPALWGPDSYEWKPERWLSPLPHTVKEAGIPGVYQYL